MKKWVIVHFHGGMRVRGEADTLAEAKKFCKEWEEDRREYAGWFRSPRVGLYKYVSPLQSSGVNIYFIGTRETLVANGFEDTILAYEVHDAS